MLRFRLHSSRSGRFCKNLLLSLKVAADYSVASLGVSVLPLHASLSTYNWDTPLPVLCLTGTQKRLQPLIEDFTEEISIMPFFRTYPMDSLLILPCMNRYNHFLIHPHRRFSGFLAHLVVKDLINLLSDNNLWASLILFAYSTSSFVYTEQGGELFISISLPLYGSHQFKMLQYSIGLHICINL